MMKDSFPLLFLLAVLFLRCGLGCLEDEWEIQCKGDSRVDCIDNYEETLDGYQPVCVAESSVKTYEWTISVSERNIDGALRPVMSINNQIPGPPIIVNQYDWIRVHVINNLSSDSGFFGSSEVGGSIHWHGLPMSGFPYNDGVPNVTQCAVCPNDDIVYFFQVNHSGTNWYHSHYNTQYADGIFGAFIIQVEGDEEKYGYDEERILIFGEWFHRSSPTIVDEIQELKWLVDFFPGRQSSFMCDENTCGGCAENCTNCYDASTVVDCECLSYAYFDTNWCNGLNSTACNSVLLQNQTFLDGECSTNLSRRGENNPAPGVTLECGGASWQQFQVEYGKTYRFRVISATSGSTFLVGVDDHTLKLFYIDGSNEVDPFSVENPMAIYVAQRNDFLLHANQSIDNYWIRGTGFRCLQAYAVLHYVDAPELNMNDLPAPVANIDFYTQSPQPDAYVTAAPMISPDPPIVVPDPDYMLVWYVGCCENVTEPDRNKTYYWEENQQLIPLNPTCNYDDGVAKQHLCWMRKDSEYLPFTVNSSVIISHQSTPQITLNKGENLRLIIFNEDVHSSHPLHFHGHDFLILEVGNGND